MEGDMKKILTVPRQDGKNERPFIITLPQWTDPVKICEQIESVQKMNHEGTVDPILKEAIEIMIGERLLRENRFYPLSEVTEYRIESIHKR